MSLSRRSFVAAASMGLGGFLADKKSQAQRQSTSANNRVVVSEVRPRVRAVTAFVEIDPKNPVAEIAEAQRFLAGAKAAFASAGFEVATLRITTQNFPEYTQGMSDEAAITFVRNLHDASQEEDTVLNIGAVTVNEGTDSAPASLLVSFMTASAVYASMITADNRGINWSAVRHAAMVIKQLSERTNQGLGNSRFAAISMLKPYGPYYPGSYHLSKRRAFAIAVEGADVVGEVFRSYKEPAEAQQALSDVFSRNIQQIEMLANQIARQTRWSYEGVDATPAPAANRSIGSAIEQFTGSRFGSPGTETAAGIITRAVQSAPVKHTGYSGLMLPVLEDNVLAERWAEGTYSLDSLLAYSAVCAGGLDTVPLPGDVTQGQIANIIGDVAWLAFRWNKPLAVRLLPAPRLKVGDIADYGDASFAKTRIQPLPGSPK